MYRSILLISFDVLDLRFRRRYYDRSFLLPITGGYFFIALKLFLIDHCRPAVTRDGRRTDQPILTPCSRTTTWFIPAYHPILLLHHSLNLSDNPICLLQRRRSARVQRFPITPPCALYHCVNHSTSVCLLQSMAFCVYRYVTSDWMYMIWGAGYELCRSMYVESLELCVCVSIRITITSINQPCIEPYISTATETLEPIYHTFIAISSLPKNA